MTALFWVFGTALALFLGYVACQALWDAASRWAFEDTRDAHTTAAGERCLCDHRRHSQASVLAAIDASLAAEIARHIGGLRAAPVRSPALP